MYGSVHEVCLGNGVLAGGNLVEYLGQDDTPLHLRGDNLKGKNKEDLLLKDGDIPDPSSTDNVEFKIVQTIIKCQLEGGETDDQKKNINTCTGVSKENPKGVGHIQEEYKHQPPKLINDEGGSDVC